LSYNGKETGVIFGFLSKLLLIAEKFNTKRFFFCWDSEWTYREQDYRGYKEHRRNRDMTPEEIEQQKSVIKQREELRNLVVPKLGFSNSYMVPGFEADDLLAVFSRRLSTCSDVVMVTRDMDMYQCLDCCSIFDPTTKKIFTKEKLKSDYCIKPNKWALAKAIGGCDSDNVRGIKGVADPKKATSMGLKYLNGKLTKGKVFDRIESEDGKAIIKTNLPIVTTPYREEDLSRLLIKRNKFEKNKFMSVFELYGLYSFLKPEKWEKWKTIFLKGDE